MTIDINAAADVIDESPLREEANFTDRSYVKQFTANLNFDVETVNEEAARYIINPLFLLNDQLLITMFYHSS